MIDFYVQLSPIFYYYFNDGIGLTSRINYVKKNQNKTKKKKNHAHTQDPYKKYIEITLLVGDP